MVKVIVLVGLTEGGALNLTKLRKEVLRAGTRLMVLMKDMMKV